MFKRILCMAIFFTITFSLLLGCNSSVSQQENQNSIPDTDEDTLNLIRSVNDIEAKKVEPLINNKGSYEQLDGKIYTAKEIKPIYSPTISIMAMSFRPDLYDVEKYIKINFYRNTSEGRYYTFFKLDHSKLFVFFDLGGLRVESVLNISNKKLELSKFELLKTGDTLEDVLKIDPSTLLAQDGTIFKAGPAVEDEASSEHIFEDGSFYTITYEKKNNVWVIDDLWLTETLLQREINSILPIDK